MMKVEDAFEVFDDYLEAVVNNIGGQEYDMRYELLQVSFFLISTEFTDPTNQFNQHVAPYFNLPKVKQQIDCSDMSGIEVCTYTLSYKDKVLSCKEAPTLLSDEFEIFMMGKLLSGDIKLRLEIASNDQSDQCFYALTSDIWEQLEVKYGQEIVRSLFAPIPAQFYEPNYDFKMVSSTL